MNKLVEPLAPGAARCPGPSTAEIIRATGEDFVYQITDKSVIVVRTKSGEIKAYPNAGLHRGTQLQPDGEGA